MLNSQSRAQLLRALDNFPKLKVAVVGDLIGDEFLYGQIARVSREAPVLVLQYRDLTRLPGGAANAANNLLELGCAVRVVGALGRDEAGGHLLDLLTAKGADVRHVRRPRGYATPVKTRILAGVHHSTRQQLVRLDRVTELDHSFHISLPSLERALSGVDSVIVSDYGYGAAAPVVFSAVRGIAVKRGIPVVVDSRFRMLDFIGATSITPNITELEAATGIPIGADRAALQRVGRQVLRRQKLTYLLVTQGRFGMTLFQRRRPPVHIPIFGSDEVADVTGAGDTVIAVFSLALAGGATAEGAARLANYAGGIVVMKRGTATVSCAELRTAVRADRPRART